MDADLARQAERWLAVDPDPATRAELQALLADGDEAGVRARFAAPLAFGTAGIRGPLGAGPARMNRVVVRRTSAGVARRLRAEQASGGLVVVGRDARHGSDVFAADAAAVFRGAGFEVALVDRPVPTPLLAFAVRHLDAVGGVQVTASHNPPADNGYKVYWRGGAQIVAPLDDEISKEIAAVEPGSEELGEGATRFPFDAVVAAYRESCLALQPHPGERDLIVVYTPLHGVARDVLADVFSAAGFADLHVVPEQSEPDPDFPTVSFPNPEEPGALDLALARAHAVAADLVIANDPDGDRIALAAPDGDGYAPLSGDEIGCLLAEALLDGVDPADGRPVVATTVVSSSRLAAIAEAHDARYAETLTGFKWLAPVAQEAEDAGEQFVLAYEQALGVMAGDAVRDKDGISAALVAADLAAGLKAEGRSLRDALDDLDRRYGVHLTAGRSLRLEGREGPQLVDEVLERLAGDPPSEVLGVPVVSVADHASGVRRSADGAEEALTTPNTALIGLELADGSRLQVRPSGTEPLLKFYVEAKEAVDGGLAATRERVRERLERLADAFLELARPA
jgi:phosphomannomutase